MNQDLLVAFRKFLETFDEYLHEHESAVFVPTHSPDLHQAIEDLREMLK